MSNDKITLGSGDNTHIVNRDRDRIDGGEGEDTLIINEEAIIIISKDTGSLGFEAGIGGKEYVYVQLSSQNNSLYTTATNFEFIEYQGTKIAVNDFESNDIHDVVFAKIYSRIVDDNIKSFVTLQNNTWSYNKGFLLDPHDPKISHEIINLPDTKISDQIILSYTDNYPGPGDIITITGGNGGPVYEVEVTVRATQSPDFIPDGIDQEKLYEDQTFIVKMSDNEYPTFSISRSNFGQVVSIINGKSYNHYTLTEGNTAGKITITASKAVEEDTLFTVIINGTGGSEYFEETNIIIADASSDDLSGGYNEGSTNEIKILKGETSVSFDVFAAKDSLDENIEEFSITIKDEYSFSNLQDYFIFNVTPNPYLSENLDSLKPTLDPYNSEALSGTLNYSKANDVIVLTGTGSTERGLLGDDTYIISHLTPKNSKLSIVDTEGDNKIQIVDNTFIAKTIFTKNAVRLTLEDSREITINSADKFTYNLGANITSGDTSDDLTYSEFAEWLGVTEVLSLTSSVEGVLTDMYVI